MKNFIFSRKLKVLSAVLVVAGLTALIYGFITEPERTWGNYLINNYYFISLAIGASFFMALQYITQSGWPSMFKRVPEAISLALPYMSVLLVLFLFFGTHSVYHWTHSEAVAGDEILKHKSPYLNETFFTLRLVVFMLVWITLIYILRRYSQKEDKTAGLEYFSKSETVSKIFIFTLAPTFSLSTFDLIMSIDAHWFSTIFALKNFVSAFYHGSALITLIVILLYKQGYFPKLNKSHLHDFSKYIFMLSVIWGYMWFAEYFLIWFSNIPEETVYFTTRISGEWKTLFFTNLAVNWLFPFLFLMLNRLAKNMNLLMFAAITVLAGMWLDIYLQVMPGVTGINSVGIFEIGAFTGFAGIFIFAICYSLSKANIIPVNHPYIEESYSHHLH